MELNDSGIAGRVTVLEKGDHLRVNLNATGLEPGRLHMQHIHGFGAGGDATCPDMLLDANMDGVLDIGEGAPAYGPVAVTLTDMESDMTDRLAYSLTFTHTDPTARWVPASAPVSVNDPAGDRERQAEHRVLEAPDERNGGGRVVDSHGFDQRHVPGPIGPREHTHGRGYGVVPGSDCHHPAPPRQQDTVPSSTAIRVRRGLRPTGRRTAVSVRHGKMGA